MAIEVHYGTGTINATLGSGGQTPSTTYTATLTHTTNYWDGVTPRSLTQDVEGMIPLSATRLNDTQVRVSAHRQLPAGEEIVFDWINVNGNAA